MRGCVAFPGERSFRRIAGSSRETKVLGACHQAAVANDGGKNRQLRHASFAGLGVGAISIGIH
jgi:hypothetical protein